MNLLLPATGRIPRIDRQTLVRNALAGLIVGLIAFPLAIALTVAVGVPPIAGLYTAIFAGGLASTFGGSRFNITGPTAALVPLLLHVVLIHGPEALPLLAMMAGVLLIGMGLLRFGRVIRYMPALVVVGFTAGIAISIAAGQLNGLLGLSGTDPGLEHFHERIVDTARHLGSITPAAAILGIASVLFLFWWQRSARRVPGALIVIVVATSLTYFLELPVETVASKYGELPSSLPRPSLAFLDAGLAFDLLPQALAIATLAGVESLLSAVVADGMAPEYPRHNPDRELLGQGIANVVAPIFGAIPSTAAIARTAAGIRNGATSRLTGVFHALTVLVLTLLLGGVAGHIPLTALAAILIVVAYGIADVPELTKLLRGSPREDLLVLAGTMIVTVVLDLTFAIALGVITSVVLLLRRLTAVPVVAEILADVAEGDDVEGIGAEVPLDVAALMRSRPDVLFFTAQGIISFHSAAAFESLLPSHDHRPLIIRMRDVHHVDSSGLLTLQGIVEHRHRVGSRVVLTETPPAVVAAMERFGLVAALREGGLAPSIEAALATIPPPVGAK